MRNFVALKLGWKQTAVDVQDVFLSAVISSEL